MPLAICLLMGINARMPATVVPVCSVQYIILSGECQHTNVFQHIGLNKMNPFCSWQISDMRRVAEGNLLTHWGWDRMAAILQMTFSSFFYQDCCIYYLIFTKVLLDQVHWHKSVTRACFLLYFYSNFTEICSWSSSLAQKCITRPQKV